MNYNNIVYDKGNLLATGPGAAFNFKGGRLVLIANATAWGGGNLWLQWTIDGSTWFTLGPQNVTDSIPLTVDGTAMLYLPPGRYRVILSAATGPAVQYAVGDANTGA
jgi:hypothetical protein